MILWKKRKKTENNRNAVKYQKKKEKIVDCSFRKAITTTTIATNLTTINAQHHLTLHFPFCCYYYCYYCKCISINADF